VAWALLTLVGICGVSAVAQTEQPPAKELLQYIREAKRRGVLEAKIKQQAVAVGWSAAVVDEAMAYEKSGNAAKPMPPASVTAAPQTPPSESTASEPAKRVALPVKAPEKPVGPSVSGPTSRGASDDYLIGSGDTLQISVWKEPEASVPAVVVRPDGRITMPLIKEVEVAGLTPRQAEAVITAGIGKFISDPNVTVVVAEINSKKIYLIGAVKKEGTIPYTYGMTIMQALSEAGGLNDYAKRKKIYILRTENGREYRLDFNYEEVIKGEKMDQNVMLLAGDTVVVPQ
jgi:polysaccharide export outer membrane protein